MDTATGQKVSFFHSLQAKYALIYIAVIAAVLVLLNTYPVTASQDQVFQSKQDALQSKAAVLSTSLGVTDTLTVEGVHQAMEVLQDNAVARVLITDPAGLILYDSSSEETIYHYALFSEIHGALSGNKVFRTEYDDGAYFSRAAAPITYRNLTIGAVYLFEVDRTQGVLLEGLRTNLRSISIIICILVLLLSLVFARALNLRFDTLLDAIKIVRKGQYSHRVNLTGHDELTLLADEFNSLTGRLQVTEEARRRFVSDASHELKTPLASIRLLTDSILQSPEIDPATTREFINDIGEEADRLTRISEKLLTLTRLDVAPSVDLAAVDVAGVVEKVAHMLDLLSSQKNLSLTLELEPDCCVLATEDDLYQVVYNLMENAIKYNVPNGSVCVRVLRSQENVLLEVSDTGIGIPADDLPKIFDRFYRVDKARSRAAGGTGLGLSIVLDTVHQHGGTITAQQREGGGSLFKVLFPSAKEGMS